MGSRVPSSLHQLVQNLLRNKNKLPCKIVNCSFSLPLHHDIWQKKYIYICIHMVYQYISTVFPPYWSNLRMSIAEAILCFEKRKEKNWLTRYKCIGNDCDPRDKDAKQAASAVIIYITAYLFWPLHCLESGSGFKQTLTSNLFLRPFIRN